MKPTKLQDLATYIFSWLAENPNLSGTQIRIAPAGVYNSYKIFLLFINCIYFSFKSSDQPQKLLCFVPFQATEVATGKYGVRLYHQEADFPLLMSHHLQLKTCMHLDTSWILGHLCPQYSLRQSCWSVCVKYKKQSIKHKLQESSNWLPRAVRFSLRLGAKICTYFGIPHVPW